MKKLIVLVLSFIPYIFYTQKKPIPQSSVCSNFHKKYCRMEKIKGEKWDYDAQSRSGLFSQGMTSKIKCVIYKGMDYRLTLCAENTLGDQLNFKIYDARTNELLFDNATADNTQVFEFQSETTRPLIIEVFVPEGGSTSEDKMKPKDAACVGLLIEHKKTDIQGFSKY